MGITKLSPYDHHERHRLFAYLDDIAPGDTEALGGVWIRLKILLEVHAAAKEELFCPHQLRIGKGAGGVPSVQAEVKDVIKDHNEIRDACAEVECHKVGSDPWWDAVAQAREPSATTWLRRSGRTWPTFASTPTYSCAMTSRWHSLCLRFGTRAASGLATATPRGTSKTEPQRAESWTPRSSRSPGPPIGRPMASHEPMHSNSQ